MLTDLLDDSQGHCCQHLMQRYAKLIFSSHLTSSYRSFTRSMSASARYKLADLPLPSKTLQGTLEQIPLPADSPTQQRRSRTFGRAGVWARVTPLPLAFPYTYEVLAGRPPDPNTQADADALFGAFDDNDEGGLKEEAQSSQLALRSSSRRREAFDPILLGVSSSCLSETLPHLDIDQRRLEQFLTCSDPDRALPNDLQDLVDVCAGRKVLMSSDYGPWSTRYAGHQFGQWAGQLGDGRAISICECSHEECHHSADVIMQWRLGYLTVDVKKSN